jgi:hypothetical protein
MRFEFKASFDKSVRRFYGEEKEELKRVAIEAIDVLSQDRLLYKGVGLRRLKDNFWEIRKGIKTRILFRWERDLVEFILA